MVMLKYRCTQLELYTIVGLGWKSCKQYLPDFADFRARYTINYIDDRIAELTYAENLPDDQARGEQAETFRIQLTEQARACLDKWQRLKRYIIDAYPDYQKPKLESAGQNLYAKAANYNWGSVKGLLTSANNFIIANQTDLLANQNMPQTFPAQFAALRNTFNTTHQQFLDSEEQAYIQTQTKLNANNDLYTKLMSMFLDGQEIFKNNDAVRKQFIFSESLYLVSGAGIAGIRGIITDSQTNQPIADVTVTIITKNKTDITDEQGKYEILQIAQGTYNIQYTKQGYQTHILQNHEVKIGTNIKIDIQLTPDTLTLPPTP